MHRFFHGLARLFAILGGIVLCALVGLVCLSILGRSLNSILNGDLLQSAAPTLANGLLALGIGPINGDFELVEAGMAFTIFAFLPLCHINGAHASVDIFTAKLPERANRFLRMVVEIAFAAVLVVIANQLFAGMTSKQNTGETTLLLQFPVWWGYAASVVAAIAAAAVAIYTAWIRSLECLTGQPRMTAEMGADH